MIVITSIGLLIFNLIFEKFSKHNIAYRLLSIILKQSIFEFSSLLILDRFCVAGIFDKEDISLENTNTVFSLASIFSLIAIETIIYLYENREKQQQPTT